MSLSVKDILRNIVANYMMRRFNFIYDINVNEKLNLKTKGNNDV